jgi:paraquat-inducible protein B
MPVMMRLYPGRLGNRFRENVPTPGNAIDQELLAQLVKRGLRGQLRTGNLLTGQLYVALDVFPRAPAAKLDLSSDPVELPTVPNTLDQLQTQVADIVRTLDKTPLDQIGSNLNYSLKDADHLFRRLGTDVVPQASDTLVRRLNTGSTAEQEVACLCAIFCVLNVPM